MRKRKKPRVWVIWLSFIIAFILQVMPWPEPVHLFRPSWLVLFMVYWGITLPYRVSIITGLVVGLIWDLLLGSIFGTRGLALAIVAYLVVFKYQLIRNMALWQQALIVLFLTLFVDLVAFWITLSVEHARFNTDILWGALVNAILWPWFFLFMTKLRQKFSIE